MENNNEIKRADLGVIYIDSDNRVGIDLMIDRKYFTPLMMDSLENVTNMLQIILMEVGRNIENEHQENDTEEK